MASPSTAITRLELGSTFSEFDLAMNRKGFIGAKVLRPRISQKSTGDFGKIPLEQLLQSAGKSTKRAPGSGYNRDTFQFDKAAFNCQEFGKEEVMDDNQLAQYADLLDAEAIHAERAIDAVLAEYERDCASTVFDPAIWTGAKLFANVSNEWDDHTNATPIADVNVGIEAVSENSGLEANALVLNRRVFRNLMQCDQILDRIKYTARPTAAEVRSALSDLFDLPHILVAGGLKNVANQGQDASIERIWSSEYAMVCRVAESDDPKEPCIGRTILWPGDGPNAPGDDGQLAVVTEEYREERVRGSVFRARNNRDIITLYVEAGFLLGNVTT